MGQPIGVSGSVLRKRLCCVCLTFLVCVPQDCGQSMGWLAQQYCNPPPEKTRSDSGTCTQDLCRRNIHTDMRPQQGCEAEVRGFPVFEGRLLVLTLQLDHITPNLRLCPHRQTDRGEEEGRTGHLSEPSGLWGGHRRLQGQVDSWDATSTQSETCKTLHSYQEIWFA